MQNYVPVEIIDLYEWNDEGIVGVRREKSHLLRLIWRKMLL